ncbi:MAG TPA: hypothetical protein VLC09_02540 [Polyangiaceae bacterium]|nr:hypothetical protein [Polyangiaceae bacterium]
MLRWVVALGWLSSLGTLFGCGQEKAEEKPLPPPIPTSQLPIPADFTGPIDPDWPPSDPSTHELNLAAARLYRKALAEGRQPPRGEPLLPGARSDVFVEEGRFGDFDYLEVVVGNFAHPDEPMPLVVLLHGRGGKPTIPRLMLPGKAPIRIFIPRAPDRLGDGYTWLAARTLDNQEQLLGRSLAGRVDQLAPLIDAFARYRKTRGRPIVAGFSQGALLTYGLAIRYPHRIAAAFPLAGWLPPELVPSRAPKGAPPIFARHGGKDDVVATRLGVETARLLKTRGYEVHYSEDPSAGHVVSEAMSRGAQKDLYRFLFAASEG